MRQLARGQDRHRRRRMAGQATVEFALVSLVFFPVFFSIIEFALITASIGSFNFATREGARVGSVLGRTDPNVDAKIIAAVTAHVSGVVMAKATEIDIYRANPLADSSNPCLDTNSNPVPIGSGSCLSDVYAMPAANPPVCSQCNWAVDTRNDSLSNADYVGVRVMYQYTYVTGFVAGLGSGLNLSTYSAQRIEPQDYNSSRQAAPSLASLAGQRLVAAAGRLTSGVPLIAYMAGEPIWKPEDARGGSV